MPRTITSLSGEELEQEQHPVALILMEIGGVWGPVAVNDSDIDLYLKTYTLDCSTKPFPSATLFVPMAGLTVPAIDQSDEALLAEVTITASNVNQFWNGVLNENEFRDALVTIWFGNLRQDGSSPEEVTFVGVVSMYQGRLDSLEVSKQQVTLRVMPHSSPHTMMIPHEPYSPDPTSRFGGFTKIPAAGTKLYWGYTETEI